MNQISTKSESIKVLTTGNCWFAFLTLTIAACPHCASLELIASDVERDGYPPEQWPSAVFCGGCGARGSWAKDEEAAVRAWNRISGIDTDRDRSIGDAMQFPLPAPYESDEIPF